MNFRCFKIEVYPTSYKMNTFSAWFVHKSKEALPNIGNLTKICLFLYLASVSAKWIKRAQLQPTRFRTFELDFIPGHHDEAKDDTRQVRPFPCYVTLHSVHLEKRAPSWPGSRRRPARPGSSSSCIMIKKGKQFIIGVLNPVVAST